MRASLIVLVASFVWAPPARAQGGNGLYSPFPEPASKERAQRYLQELGVEATAGDLDAGRVVGLRPGAGTGPSTRAGDDDSPGLSLLLALLVPLVATATLGRSAG